MNNQKTKRILLTIIPLIVIIVLIITLLCVLFGNTYVGIYKKVADADREQFAENTLKKLDALEDLKTFKCTFRAKTGKGWDGGGEAEEAVIIFYVDGNKFRAEITRKAPIKFTATAWVNNDTDDIYYKIKVDGKIQEGKYESDQELSNELWDVIGLLRVYVTPISGVVSLKHSLNNEKITLYSYRNKLKAVSAEIDESGNGYKSETYFILGSNGTYRWKNQYKVYENGKEFGFIYKEIQPSNEKVTMPNIQ